MSDTYQTPFTYASLQALESAIIQGVLTVKYTDKEVTYRSLDELMRIRQLIRGQLGLDGASGDNTGFFGGKRKVARHTKGLGKGE